MGGVGFVGLVGLMVGALGRVLEIVGAWARPLTARGPQLPATGRLAAIGPRNRPTAHKIPHFQQWREGFFSNYNVAPQDLPSYQH